MKQSSYKIMRDANIVRDAKITRAANNKVASDTSWHETLLNASQPFSRLAQLFSLLICASIPCTTYCKPHKNSNVQPFAMKASLTTTTATAEKTTKKLVENKIIIESTNSNHASQNPFNQLNFSHKNPLSMIQERYLTIHTGKKEKIQAVYENGVYGIAYIQKW